MKAEIIKSTGEIIPIKPINKIHFSLKELQDIVGGYIEIVHLGNRECMVVNEDGLNLDLPLNKKATNLYKHNLIVGDVLVCNLSQIN